MTATKHERNGYVGEPIGIVGLGAMGIGLARALIAAGIRVHGFDISRDALSRAAAEGAYSVPRLEDLAADCAAIITVLPDGPDVRAVAPVIAAHARQGCVIVDASTIDPEITRELGRLYQDGGLRFADAAMAGSATDAAMGKLMFLVGSSLDDFPSFEAILSPIARRVVRCGEVGAGVTMKLINNALALSILVADVEALAVATKAGIRPEVAAELLSSTTAANAALEQIVKADLLNRKLAGAFRLSLAHKDAKLADGLANRLGFGDVTVTHAAMKLREAVEAGYGDRAVSAVGLAIEANAGVDLRITSPTDQGTK